MFCVMVVGTWGGSRQGEGEGNEDGRRGEGEEKGKKMVGR